jgi:DNA-binding transcriptional ArsR family regulator
MNAFSILGDPVRRRILEHLAARDMASGDVVEVVGGEFEISQSAISQHLRVLRENGFASVEVEGTRRIYSLDTIGLQDIDQWLTPFRQFWGPKFEALAKEVENDRKSKSRKEKGERREGDVKVTLL